MRRFIFPIIFILASLPPWAPGVAPVGANDASDVARGRELMRVNCSGCHAIGVTGDSTHKDAPPFREVMKAYPARDLTEALGEGLMTGHPDMPEFVFPPQDVFAIVSYLSTLEGK
jgi:cytochrome c